MSKWLTQEWLDETKKMADSQPERPGASARMQYVVTGGPDGEIKYYWVLENGKLLESKLGDLPDAEVTMTQTYEDAMKIQKGELDANAAFMQGRIKVTRQHGQADGAACRSPTRPSTRSSRSRSRRSPSTEPEPPVASGGWGKGDDISCSGRLGG